jgi:hypothetical protein
MNIFIIILCFCNFFIETNNYNYKLKKCFKSGILKTLSNYYILINEDTNDRTIKYYIIITKKLKRIIKKFGIKKSCLNRKTLIYSNGYIIKKDDIIKYCKYIFIEYL